MPRDFVDVLDGSTWRMAFVSGKMSPSKYLCAWVPQGDSPPASSIKTWTNSWGMSSRARCSGPTVRARGCFNRSKDVELYSSKFLIDPPAQPLEYFTLNVRTGKWRKSQHAPTRRPGYKKNKKDRTSIEPIEASLRVQLGDRLAGIGTVVEITATRVTAETTLRNGESTKQYIPLIEVEEGLASEEILKLPGDR